MPKLKYKCDWSKIKEKALSRHQQEYKIGSVTQAVMHAVARGELENPYLKYEAMQRDQTPEVDLHASHGTKLQEQGGHVLEFDLAGSGYKQFQSRHAGLDGEDHYYKDGVFIPFEDIDREIKWEVHWWNRLPGFLRAVLGVASESDIRIQNEAIDELKQADAVKWPEPERHTGSKTAAKTAPKTGTKTSTKTSLEAGTKANSKTGTKASPEASTKANFKAASKFSPEANSKTNLEAVSKSGSNAMAKTRSEALIRRKFGEHSKLKEFRDKKYIYVKDNTVEGPDHTKTYRVRYSMPGSQSTILGYWRGARNKGEYSISNVNNYMLTAGKHYLETIFKEWDKGENPVKKADASDAVTIMIKGHSRGGVAAAQGAMMLKYWIKTWYPRYENRVRFKLLQLDPVAGFGSDHGTKRMINLAEEQRPELRQEMAEKRMASLGDSGDTTVVYSLHTNHPLFFSPQSVDGAKRIILTAANHGVNLGAVDDSQKEHGDTGNHRKGYLDLSTGEMYRSSGLHELPEGIYIADENNRLIKVPSLEVGRSIVNEVLANTSGQKDRHERIDEVMKNWFEAHEKRKNRNADRYLNLNADRNLNLNADLNADRNPTLKADLKTDLKAESGNRKKEKVVLPVKEPEKFHAPKQDNNKDNNMKKNDALEKKGPVKK